MSKFYGKAVYNINKSNSGHGQLAGKVGYFSFEFYV
jgi:hypothetical protein